MLIIVIKSFQNPEKLKLYNCTETTHEDFYEKCGNYISTSEDKSDYYDNEAVYENYYTNGIEVSISDKNTSRSKGYVYYLYDL